MMKKYLVKITRRGVTMFLQGFDVCGCPITGVEGTAHAYPSLLVEKAQMNAVRYYSPLAQKTLVEIVPATTKDTQENS